MTDEQLAKADGYKSIAGKLAAFCVRLDGRDDVPHTGWPDARSK
jgi:hypothetical protein